MADTTTTLNPGSGGDVVDESLVTQSDGVTVAKRQRVQIGGGTGTALVEPVTADPGANPYSLPTLLVALVGDAPAASYIDGQLRPVSLTTEGRLRTTTIPAREDIDFFGGEDDTAPSFFGTSFTGTNPWE